MATTNNYNVAVVVDVDDDDDDDDCEMMTRQQGDKKFTQTPHTHTQNREHKAAAYNLV